MKRSLSKYALNSLVDYTLGLYLSSHSRIREALVELRVDEFFFLGQKQIFWRHVPCTLAPPILVQCENRTYLCIYQRLFRYFLIDIESKADCSLLYSVFIIVNCYWFHLF